MALKDIFKVSRRTFFDPSAWLGLGAVKNTNRVIVDTVKGIITPPDPGKPETFEEALKRFNLTEADIKERSKSYLLLALFFAACGLGVLLYGLYLLFSMHAFLGFLLALAVTSLFLAQAFQLHFWHFQIENRKLGCTFDEWWQGKVNTNQEPHP